MYTSSFKKYNNKKTIYNNLKYDSKFEAGVAQELDLRLKSGEYAEVQRQVRLDLRAYDQHICYYKIDFIAIHPDGIKEYIEAKGYATRDWMLKWKLLEAQLSIEEPTSVMTLIRQ